MVAHGTNMSLSRLTPPPTGSSFYLLCHVLLVCRVAPCNAALDARPGLALPSPQASPWIEPACASVWHSPRMKTRGGAARCDWCLTVFAPPVESRSKGDPSSCAVVDVESSMMPPTREGGQAAKLTAATPSPACGRRSTNCLRTVGWGLPQTSIPSPKPVCHWPRLRSTWGWAQIPSLMLHRPLDRRPLQQRPAGDPWRPAPTRPRSDVPV